jgi:dTDP-glucose 4,6-dehydratase
VPKLRALVTGGAGFVGSHLCERLLAEGYRVVCMDKLRTGSLENVAHLLEGDADFEYKDHDVTSYIRMPGELDEIYHFASPASPKDFTRIPIPILKVGALGTYNALGLAKAKGARIMLASSEVYGDPLVHPQPEDYRGNVNPIGVRGVYDEAKRYAESITFAYHRHYKVETRIVRINTYRPRMRVDDGRMIPNFITQALSGHPLTVYGDGTQTRSVLYVDDLIEGVFRLMKSDERRPVNIGNPEERTVGELGARSSGLPSAREIVRL